MAIKSAPIIHIPAANTTADAGRVRSVLYLAGGARHYGQMRSRPHPGGSQRLVPWRFGRTIRLRPRDVVPTGPL